MRIVVPYTHLTEGVVAALDATGYPYELVEMVAEDSYWRLLTNLWADGEDFAVVEHDITVHPSVFDELEACPEPWCVYPHEYVQPSYYGMGCVRFRSELLTGAPGVMHSVGERSDHVHPPRHWCSLDKWLQDELPRTGVTMHHHDTVLGHARRKPAHECL